MTAMGAAMLTAFLAACLGGLCYLIGYTHGIEHNDINRNHGC